MSYALYSVQVIGAPLPTFFGFFSSKSADGCVVSESRPPRDGGKHAICFIGCRNSNVARLSAQDAIEVQGRMHTENREPGISFLCVAALPAQDD
jgi:hypothetical protein